MVNIDLGKGKNNIFKHWILPGILWNIFRQETTRTFLTAKKCFTKPGNKWSNYITRQNKKNQIKHYRPELWNSFAEIQRKVTSEK